MSIINIIFILLEWISLRYDNGLGVQKKHPPFADDFKDFAFNVSPPEIKREDGEEFSIQSPIFQSREEANCIDRNMRQRLLLKKRQFG